MIFLLILKIKIDSICFNCENSRKNLLPANAHCTGSKLGEFRLCEQAVSAVRRVSQRALYSQKKTTATLSARLSHSEREKFNLTGSLLPESCMANSRVHLYADIQIGEINLNSNPDGEIKIQFCVPKLFRSSKSRSLRLIS